MFLIIMYNVPGRTGTNIQPATAVKIAKSVDNIVAIKEASGDIGQGSNSAALADGCLDIYSEMMIRLKFLFSIRWKRCHLCIIQCSTKRNS